MSFQKVRAILNFAIKSTRSSFYRDKYRKERFEISGVRTFAEFEKIPFLTREEIVNTPALSRIFISEKEISTCFTSSGTVSRGNPLIMPANRVRQAYYTDHLLAKLKELCVNKILLLANPSYVNGRIVDAAAHPALSKFPIIYCDMNNLGLAARLAVELKVDGIETTPSALNFLIPYLKEVHDLSGIKFVSLGGEFTSEQKLKFFKSYFKNAYFEFRFGGAETRFIKAFRCEHLAGNAPPYVFHPHSHYYLFEVVDGSGKSTREGKSGELILTSLTKNAPLPLIRYKTGDLVSLYKKNCPCGKREFIEILGRVGYDSARIGGITLRTDMIEEALEKVFPKLDGEYELHLYEEVYNNRLMPRIVLKLSSARSNNIEKLRKRIEENFRVATKLYLSDLVRQEVFLPLKLEIVDSFPKAYKKIKIISHIK